MDSSTGGLKYKYRAITDAHPIPSSSHTLSSLLIIRIEEGLFFGNSGQLKDRLKRVEVFGDLNVHPGEEPRRPLSRGDSSLLNDDGLKVVIFDMAAVGSIDAR